MIRHSVWAVAFLCCSQLIAAEPLRAEPACLYASKSYSDGAFVCVQKALMLSCSSDGARATWKIVADKDLSQRCVVPTTVAYAPPRPQARRIIRARMNTAAGSAAKCFHFNGKQYCE